MRLWVTLALESLSILGRLLTFILWVSLLSCHMSDPKSTSSGCWVFCPAISIAVFAASVKSSNANNGKPL